MNKAIASVIASILILSAFTFISSIDEAYAKSNKVTICHIPPGNPENAHTITVSENAVKTHLAHGDFIGTCEDGPDCVNYPDQESCPKESILLVNAYYRWQDSPPAAGASCSVLTYPASETITEFVLDEDGNAEVHIPSEFTEPILVLCVVADFNGYPWEGSTFVSIINPGEVISVDILMFIGPI